MKPINLNKVRKARARDAARVQADVNAATFGVPKADRAKAQTEQEKAKRDLDGHQRE